MAVNDHIPLKPDFFHILLALEHEPLHGWGIIKRVSRDTDGKIVLEPSPLYRRLKKLLEAGIVGETDVEHHDDRRRYYSLTPFGRKVLAAEAARLVRLASNSSIKRLARS